MGVGLCNCARWQCSKQGDILALRLTWLQAMDAQRTFKTPDIIDRTATPREPQKINNASQIRIKCLRPGSKDTELLSPENGFRRSGALAKKKKREAKYSNNAGASAARLRLRIDYHDQRL